MDLHLDVQCFQQLWGTLWGTHGQTLGHTLGHNHQNFGAHFGAHMGKLCVDSATAFPGGAPRYLNSLEPSQNSLDLTLPAKRQKGNGAGYHFFPNSDLTIRLCVRACDPTETISHPLSINPKTQHRFLNRILWIQAAELHPIPNFTGSQNCPPLRNNIFLNQ